MTADDRDLAVRQARDTAALARELVATTARLVAGDRALIMLRRDDLPQQDATYLKDRLEERFPGVEFTLLPGVTQLAIQRPGDVSPCTWGDDAWHRAVNRLIRHDAAIYVFQRLLAEERGKAK